MRTLNQRVSVGVRLAGVNRSAAASSRLKSSVAAICVGMLGLSASSALGQLIAADSFLNNPSSPSSPNIALGQYVAVAPNQLRRGEANGGGQNPTIAGFTGPWSGNVTSGTLGVAQWTSELDPIVTPQTAAYHAGGRTRFGGAATTNALQRRVQRPLSAYTPSATYYFSLSSQVLIGDDASTAGFVGVGFTSTGLNNGDDAHYTGASMRGFMIGAATDGPTATDYVIRHVGSSGVMQQDVVENDILQTDGIQTVIARYTVVRLDVNDDPTNPQGNSKLTIWHQTPENELYTETAATSASAPLVLRTFAMTSSSDLTQLTLMGLNWSKAASFDEPRLGRSWSDVVISPNPTWITNADGNWSESANWTGGPAPAGVPNSSAARAVLGSAITADRTITLDVPVNLRSLTLTSGARYTLNGLALTLNGLDAGISAARGSHVINAPVVLSPTSTLRASSGAALRLNDVSLGTGGALTITGAGEVAIGGTLTNDGALTTSNTAPARIARLVGGGTVSVNENTQLVIGSTGVTGTILDQSLLEVGGALRIDAGGSVSATSVVDQILVGANGTLSLDRGLFIVDYADASPLATLTQEISEGRNGGTWDGLGINSVGLGSAVNEFIGIAEASVLGGNVFGGVTVDATAVLVRRTLNGDANLDGQVNFSDLLIMARNYGTTGRGWGEGNFDYLDNGVVSFTDLLSLSRNYGQSLAGPLASIDPATFESDWLLAQSMVPEPALLSLAPAVAMLLRRRMRQ